MIQVGLIAAWLAYLVIGRLVVARLGGVLRDIAFSGLNVVGFYWFFLHGKNDHFNAAFIAYLGLVLGQYAMLRLFGKERNWKSWLAFFTPIAILIAARYLPYGLASVPNDHLRRLSALPLTTYLVGYSYVAFRSSQLVLEVRNGAVPMPSLWQYTGFCLFAPTIPVGPINPYRNFRRAFEPLPPVIPAGRAALRVVVGLVKYLFLGALCDQLGYSALLKNGHYHHWIDLPVAVVFYYLYLYLNFSGFCDMAIGAAGLMGIPVTENFDIPFAARNVKDFWNRWHITLSAYMRDVVFNPLSKFLVRLFGPAQANHAIALAIVVVFLLVGIWHGVGWNYAAFGAAHALGVVVNHYYTIGLKKWLGRDGFRAYNANGWIRSAAVCVTFCYCAASLFLFANTFSEITAIFASLL
ncbi:MAG: MBOAT family O-acyltransferase [Chthoniobacter sp.]|uniref:MBOAT family O-acyltransferase n=1 Tax=Chthoniobacter sp. TaxID=2510640 RepID=UPI0032AE1C07